MFPSSCQQLPTTQQSPIPSAIFFRIFAGCSTPMARNAAIGGPTSPTVSTGLRTVSALPISPRNCRSYRRRTRIGSWDAPLSRDSTGPRSNAPGTTPATTDSASVTINWGIFINGSQDVSRRHYVGIFCISLATLLLELAFTRVLAVASWYHFAFLIISMALLGFGTSGVVLTLWEWLRERASIDHSLAALSLLFGCVVFISYWLMQKIPFNPFLLLSDHGQFLFMPLYYAVVAAPFFCSGLTIGLLLFRGRQKADRLYAADLIGGGVGCAAIALIMPIFGGSGSVMVAAAFGFLAAAVFGFAEARGLAVAGIALAVLALPLALTADQLIPISAKAAKHHPLQPKGGVPLYTAWNTFSRIDVYSLAAAPERGWPDSGFSIMIDGGSAGTGIGDLSGGAVSYLTRPEYRPTGVAYVGKTKHPRGLPRLPRPSDA